MNKRNFVFNYVPLKSDFDDLQNDMEAGIKDVAKAVAGMGILSGLTVNIASSEATISPGTAFDGQGNRIELEEALEVNIGSITRPSAGKYKWVTLALRYEVADEGQLIDGNNKRWPARLLDSYSALFLEGDEETAEAAVKPAFQNWQVPLLDILVDRSSTWENLVTETGRRPILIPISTASAQLEAHKDVSITSSHAVHGIRQGSGHGFDADLLDGAHKDTDGTLAANTDDLIPTERAVRTYIQAKVMPVGSIYFQLKNQSAPSSLFGGTWENISSVFSGLFFRAEGGEAGSFNSPNQNDAIRNIAGFFSPDKIYSTDAGNTGPFYNEDINRGYREHSPSHFGGRLGFDASRVVPTASENRPVNSTMRIWKRTA